MTSWCHLIQEIRKYFFIVDLLFDFQGIRDGYSPRPILNLRPPPHRPAPSPSTERYSPMKWFTPVGSRNLIPLWKSSDIYVSEASGSNTALVEGVGIDGFCDTRRKTLQPDLDLDIDHDLDINSD